MSHSLLEKALVTNPELIHKIFESMPEPTFLLNREGYYVEAWGGTDLKRHHDPSCIIGLHQYDVLPADKAKWFIEVINQVLDENRYTELEYDLDPKALPAFQNEDGPKEVQYFSSLLIPLQEQQLVLWAVRNISEYKRALMRLEEHQAELEHLTYTDHLTQLHNRYALESLLPPAIHATHHSQQDGAFFMIDIDHFKLLNDCYGHLQGDQALRAVSEQIRLWCKNSGIAFRYGGDEFLVFMRNVDETRIVEQANELAKAIRALQIPNAESKVCSTLTVTIGIKVCHHTSEVVSIERYINLADSALFDAKKLQRGSIHLFS
ncbi:sensor domain-containing diguanylate cyclase [Vibrio sp. SCSIO 43136]|uniref:sensor domain-containing diguanylate cyclase n=1 Tax=Vibrio sp. SCSIO 43136 TaxID=2819101 RepID=UPI00207667BD|nr:sensor domain-containing diguanylate cyclase [Vibrio sp. SCSIO 43136]USD66172.1 diguanylate cyclase [Vibrio sp. SCSIO 43136]